jgi:two-component system phosphate regulon sensor histidine kinase PhoR
MRPRAASWVLFGKLFGVVLPASLLIMGGGAFFVQQPPLIQLVCLIGLVLLLVGLCAWLTGAILAPVTRVTNVAVQIARGELAARAPAGSRDAVGALGEALDAAAERIERRVREVESQGQQAQAILESMAEGVLALDGDGRILWLNGSAKRLLGADAARAAGVRLTEVFRQAGLEELIQEALTQPSAEK